jgi:hypothetical protein
MTREFFAFLAMIAGITYFGFWALNDAVIGMPILVPVATGVWI